MFWRTRLPAAAITALGALVMLGNTEALAYTSGSLGYDISYLQCSGSAASAVRQPAQVGPLSSAAPARSARTLQAGQAPTAWWAAPQRNPPAGSAAAPRTWWTHQGLSFGIIGVDSGYPFMSSQHPGNPCLASQYAHAPQPGLYVNTGYDPTYTDANHTTPDCANQSTFIAGTSAQKAAWAVGCSEAQGDYGYASSKGITSPTGWWLDVEIGNSWCGQPGTSCTDRSLNQYTIQGLIDELTHIGAVPIGIYSNNYQWHQLVGNLPVTGATSDWVAIGPGTAQQAATHCSSSDSFSGAPVSLVQFTIGTADRDYAC